MKKYISLIVFSLCAFFLLGINVKALNVNIDFDKNEHFNFFYEMKENTPFYRYLVGQGENLVNTLSDYLVIYGNPFITIQYISDSGLSYSGAAYVIKVYHLSCGGDVSSNSAKIIYEVENSKFAPLYTQFVCSSNSSSYVNNYYFDENANFLSAASILLNYVSQHPYKFLGYRFFTLDNIEYLLSFVYYSDLPISYLNNSDYPTKPTLKLDKIIIDGTEYKLSSQTDNFWTRTWNSIKSFFTGVDYLSESTYGLEYFRKNYIISDSVGFPGLIRSLSNVSDNLNYTIPSTYLSESFNLDSELSLFPLSSCSLNDLALYVSPQSSELEDFNLYLHSISNTDELGYQGSYFSTYSVRHNSTIKINPLGGLYTLDYTLTNLSTESFINYYYRFHRTTNFGNYIVYYNPNCYVSQVGDETITWTNPLTNNEISIDSSFSNWTDPENLNPGNSIPFMSNPEDFGINLTNWVSTSWNSANSFLLAGVEIVSLSTIFFNSLPSEVSAIIISAFILGILILLIKLFKNLVL